ncbi:MAG: acyl-CoA dehydrogenase family protein [Methylotenera sp.]|nr:acyl-CoA dehydrogenase family protein [Oligoflexia bacterium]
MPPERGPVVSATQKNATQNSFMKSLFFGQIQEELIFPYPEVPAETNETVRMVLDSVDRFAREHVKSAEWDEKGEMPREIVSLMAEMGMMGMAVPEEFGGLGLPQSGYARIMQEVAGIDGSLGVTLGAHQSIGYKALLLFGTDEQKKRFLPRLASGEMIACYCLTEPSSGSDAASIKTTATLSGDGTHYVLNGNKLWITNGGIASFMTVFAKVEVEEAGPNGDRTKKEKVTCFLLELPAQGVTAGPSEHKLGIRASWTNAIHFDNVRVPVENVVSGVGQGFKVAMGVLNHGRLGLAAGAIGGAKRALQASIEHSNERVQFQKKLHEFGMIKEKIGRLMMNIYVAESMTYMTTNMVDRKDLDYSIESAVAKVFCSEMLWEAVDENLQIWGGSGYMKEYPYERWLRDARINRIFEGTNEILRAFIALSGMQGPGQELAGIAAGMPKDLAEAIKFPLKGLGPLGELVARKIKRNTVGETISKAHPSLKKMAGVLEEHAVEFGTQVEVLLRRHGKKIHLRQFAQKRIADIAIDFYAMACVLSRVTSSIQKAGGDVTKCELEIAMAEAFFQRANRRIKGNFKTIDRNDDDHMKLIADKAAAAGRYPFDVITPS